MAQKTNTTSTKSFVEISEIRESAVILKNGSLRSVIEVNSLNFALKSVDEQTAIISGFQDFINSIDFPIQILASSRKLNIDNYLKTLETLQNDLTNELLKIQAVEYTRFIKGLTELSDIMSKKFYVVIPFYTIDAASSSKKSFFSSISNLLKPSQFIQNLSEKDFASYKAQLDQRIDLVVSGLAGIGLNPVIISGEELQNVFYGFYNPEIKSQTQ